MNEFMIPVGKNIKVFVNDRKLQTLMSFDVQKEKVFYPLKEVLCGETEHVKIVDNYTLKLMLSGEEEFPDKFFIRITTLTDARTYTDCRVTLVNEKADCSKGFCREYTVKARGCNNIKL